MIKDSYEDEDEDEDEDEEEQEQESQQFPSNPGNIEIQITLPDSFDRDAYIIFPSSQLSTDSELHSSLEQPREIPNSSQLDTPAPRRKPPSFIWDEDIEITEIPDSQEERPSSSYIPSETQASKGILSQNISNTDTSSGQEISAIGETEDLPPLDNQTQSDVIDSQLAEPKSGFASASYITETSAGQELSSAVTNLSQPHTQQIRSSKKVTSSIAEPRTSQPTHEHLSVSPEFEVSLEVSQATQTLPERSVRKSHCTVS